MERDIPNPYTRIRPRTRQPLLPTPSFSKPRNGIHTPRRRALDRDIAHLLFDAPDVYVGVEGGGGEVLGVGGEGEGVDAAGVEGPAGGDELGVG